MLDGDQAKTDAIVTLGQGEQPGWDATAEIQRIQATPAWRRRRQPSFLRFLLRVVHLGRVRGG